MYIYIYIYVCVCVLNVCVKCVCVKLCVCMYVSVCLCVWSCKIYMFRTEHIMREFHNQSDNQSLLRITRALGQFRL